MKADRIASVVFILVGLLLWSQTGELQYNGMIFPRLLIVLLVLLSAVMFGQTFIVKTAKKTGTTKDNLKYIIVSTIIVFGWVYLLDILGFVVTSVLCLSILTIILDLQRPAPLRVLFSIGVYTAMVLVFWLIFHSFLLVPLPTGYLV